MRAVKKLLAAAMSILIAVSLGSRALTAYAEEPADGEGFSIEEMPEFGAADEILFPPDEPTSTETPPPVSTLELSDVPAAIEEAKLAQDTPTEESAATDAPSTPEADSIPSEHNNYPVMIIAAVLAIGVIAAALIRKRKRNTAMDD